MKKLLRTGVILLTLTITGAALSGCKNNGGDNPPPPPPGPEYYKVNNYILEISKLYYLWNNYIPGNLKADNETDPYELFDKILYTIPADDWKDNWSALTDDADGMLNNVQNTGTTFGYSLAWGKFSNDATGTKRFGIVDFVYPGSPAEEAGISRGDIILTLNGSPITAGEGGNIMDIFYAPQVTLGMGVSTDTGIAESDVKHTLQSRSMYLDPIVKTKVFETDDRKIGYIFYSDYIRSSEDALKAVFTNFKAAGVNDIILDLRSNGGGTTTTAELLCNILAPADVVAGEKLMYTDQYNSLYTAYLAQEGVLDEYTKYYFSNKTPVNMNLPRVYILTSSMSASASEMTIASLKPYMEVIIVGEQTHGKFCGGVMFPSPKMGTDGKLIHDTSKIDDWLMYLIIFKFVNADGYTDFFKGIPPTHVAAQDWFKLYPLGDENDELVNAALTHIKTGAFPAKKQAPGTRSSQGMEIITDGLPNRSNQAPDIILRQLPSPLELPLNQ